jgi:parallel beta-helix repeat protein
MAALSISLAGLNMSAARAQAEFTETVTAIPTQTATAVETDTPVQSSDTSIPSMSAKSSSGSGELLVVVSSTPSKKLSSPNISASTVLSAGTYNEDYVGITYTSNWEAKLSASATNGTYKRVYNYGEKASFAFNGNKLTVIYTKSPWSGVFQVSIDGTNYKFDSYYADTQYQAKWTSPTLSSGSHSAAIQNISTDGKITFLDGLIITASTPVPTSTLAAVPTRTATRVTLPPATPTRTPTNAPTKTAIAAYTPTSSSSSGTGSKAYYVSSAGNNIDGNSWATAWKGLAQINWSIVQPGDTIYISGGTASATYPGGIQISKSGTASGYITIDTGANSPSPAGHNGTVIIEGGDYCIRGTGSYLKIRNLLCQHATSSGLRIEGTGSVLENNTIRETYGQGIHVTYCTSCIVRGNRITTFPNDGPSENRPYQTDGIVAYDTTNTLIEGNWIKLTNQYESAHIDGIQASTNLGKTNKNITIRYNYVENTKADTRNAQGIYLTQMQGDVKIIANVVLVPIGGQAVASILPNDSPVSVYVIGNTFKNGGYWVLHVEDDDPIIKNNIVWQTGGSDAYVKNGTLIRLDNRLDSSNPSHIDNNLLYAPYGSTSTYAFYLGSSAASWSSWQAKGFDSHGIYGQNPNLDSCFRPTGTSPSIGKGAILADEYDQGLSLSLCGPNGPAAFLPVLLSNRNQYGGSSWDIGVYEK